VAELGQDGQFFYLILDTLCHSDIWPFAGLGNWNHPELNYQFNQTCCPILYKICDSMLSVPQSISLPSDPTDQIVGMCIIVALAAIVALVEILNILLTEVCQLLPRPRCLFFPLPIHFFVLSKQ
jgi:hypothetical protein